MSATNSIPATVGLYRHFKGAYYYVTGFSKNAHDDSVMVNYFNVCHPEYISCTRTLTDFIRTVEEDGRIIKDRPDNVTGQSARFEKVHDLNFQLGSVPTEHLIAVLKEREDSPLQDLDIEGLNDCVFCTDYIIGEKISETEDTPRGVYHVMSFTTEDEAKNYFDRHTIHPSDRVFKRVFIEMK